MIVYILGAHGVGKTTVLNTLKEKLGENWVIINFADEMIPLIENLGISRDEMRTKLDLITYRKTQNEASKNIRKKMRKNKGKNFIIDSHAVVPTQFGLWPAFPLNILKRIKPDIIIYIYATPQEIMKRRKKDVSRKRSLDINEIKEELETSEFYCYIYSVLSGAPLFKVHNKEGKLEETVKEILEVISKYKSR